MRRINISCPHPYTVCLLLANVILDDMYLSKMRWHQVPTPRGYNSAVPLQLLRTSGAMFNRPDVQICLCATRSCCCCCCCCCASSCCCCCCCFPPTFSMSSCCSCAGHGTKQTPAVAVVHTSQSRLLAPSVVTRLPFVEDVIVPHAAPFCVDSIQHVYCYRVAIRSSLGSSG